MVLTRILFLILLLLPPFQIIFGQTTAYNFDQNLPSIHWNYSLDNSKKIQVISPESSDFIHHYIQKKINLEFKNIQDDSSFISNQWNLIFQRDFNVSNGFVTYFNPRIEFYGYYPQDPSLIGTNNWLDILVSHELRHVYQYEISLQYSPKVIKLLAGKAMTTAWAGLVIPNWAWEGDAILKESELNPLGRLNNPQSYNPLLALLDRDNSLSYSQALGRSYKRFIPNHYLIGQTLSDNIRKEFGQEALMTIWKKSVNKGYFPFSFSFFFKKLSGFSIDQWSENLFSSLADSIIQKDWDAQFVDIQNNDIFSNYRSVIPLAEKDFFAIRTSYDKIPALVRVQNGKETIIRNFGPRSDDYNLSMGGDYVIFTENKPHIRFQKSQNSLIYLYNIKNGELIKWKELPAIPSVAISPKAEKITYLNLQDNGNVELVVKDFNSHKTLYSKIYSFEYQLSSLQMDENKLAFVEQNKGQKKIQLIDLNDFHPIDSINFGNQNIGYISLADNKILYTKNIENLDQIYLYDLNQKKEAKLTESKFGAYFPRVYNQELYASYYTADGLKPVKKNFDLDNLNFQPKEFISWNYPFIHSESKDSLTISPKPLKTLNKLFSWGLLPSNSINQLTVGAEMANSLSNWQIIGGTSFNYTERNWEKFITYSYNKFFPEINFSYRNRSRSTSFYVEKEDRDYSDTWQENRFLTYISFPFNFTRSAYQTYMTIHSGLSMNIIHDYDLKYRTIKILPNGFFPNYFNTFQFQHFKSRSLLDLGSRFGFLYRLDYLKSLPNNKNIQGELFVQTLSLNLPGFLRHDFIELRLGYQSQKIDNYLFASSMKWPLNVPYIPGEKNLAYGFSYSFPIISTEWEIGRLIYFKRFKGKLFFDQAMVINKNQIINSNLSSFGLDLSSNLHLFRFFQEFDLGIRIMNNTYNKKWIIVPIVINIGI